MHGLGLKCQPFHRFSSRVKEICLDEKISNNKVSSLLWESPNSVKWQKKRLRQKGTSPLSLILDGFEGIAKLPLETGWWFKYDCFPILAVYVIVECHSWRGFSTFPRSNVRTRQKGPSPLLLILAGFWGDSQNTGRHCVWLKYDWFSIDVFGWINGGHCPSHSLWSGFRTFGQKAYFSFPKNAKGDKGYEGRWKGLKGDANRGVKGVYHLNWRNS